MTDASGADEKRNLIRLCTKRESRQCYQWIEIGGWCRIKHWDNRPSPSQHRCIFAFQIIPYFLSNFCTNLLSISPLLKIDKLGQVKILQCILKKKTTEKTKRAFFHKQTMNLKREKRLRLIDSWDGVLVLTPCNNFNLFQCFDILLCIDC